MGVHVTDEEIRAQGCPRSNCKATPQQPCVSQDENSAQQRKRFHRERVKAAREAKPRAKDRV